jgi:hypothetical protein
MGSVRALIIVPTAAAAATRESLAAVADVRLPAIFVLILGPVWAWRESCLDHVYGLRPWDGRFISGI